MPALASPSTWRSHPHRIEGYLAVLVPDTVFACSVNQTDFEYPVYEFEYDGVTVGAYTDVVVGQTVKVSDSGGTFKGYARVRAAPDSDTLYIGAVPSGEILFADDDLVEVLDEYRPWNVIPKITVSYPNTADFYKDYLDEYTDQNEYPPPVANTGPHFADLVDSDGYVYVSWDLTAICYPVADGSSISTYAADLGDGTVTSGSIASGIFTAKFPAGTRWITITVTDDNAKSHTAKMLIVANEKTGSNAPIHCRIEALSSSLDGSTAEFVVLQDDASAAAIPNQAMVIYYEKEVYATASGSLNGFSGREHVKFVGWVDTDGVNIDPETSDISLSCVGPMGVTNYIAAFSASLSDSDSPADWYEMKDLTLFKLIYYLLKWHTTLLDVCDLEEPDWADDTPYHRFSVSEGSLFSTLNNQAEYYNARLTCDRQGMLYVRRDQIMMSDADRTGVVTTVTLEDHDWDNVSVIERNYKQVYWVRASGLLASRTDVTPYLSIAPGKSPGQGGYSDQLNNQMVSGQTELNVRSGRYYGRKNSQYERITINVWPGGLVADPALREYIVFDLDASTNRRGIEFSSTKFILHEVRARYDHENGTMIEAWVLEMETSGTPGETLPIPIDRVDDYSFVGLPPFRPIDDYDPRPDPDIEFANAPAVYICHGSYITRTRNHTDGTPNYEIVLEDSDFDDVAGFSGFLGPFILDPWNPKQAAYVMVRRDGVSDGEVAVCYIENLNGPAGSQVLSLIDYDSVSDSLTGEAGGACLQAGINVQGSLWWSYIKYGFNGKLRLQAVLAEGGSVYSTNDSFLCSNSSRPWLRAGYHQAGGGVGRMYAMANGYGAVQGAKVFSRNDMGQAWNESTDEILNFHDYGAGFSVKGSALYIPYDDNPSDIIMYASCAYAALNGLLRQDSWGVFTGIAPQYSGNYYYVRAGRDNIHAYTGDRQDLCIVGQNSTTYRLFTSEDGGDNFTDRNAPAGSTTYLNSLWGWSTNRDIMITNLTDGASRGPYWTQNLFSASQYGITWNSMLGDWETVTGDTWSNPSDIVPVWVA